MQYANKNIYFYSITSSGGDLLESQESNSAELSYSAGTDDWYIQVVNMQFCKEMYTPNTVDLLLHITITNKETQSIVDASYFSKVQSLFIDATLDIKAQYLQDGTTQTEGSVVSGYVITRVHPRYSSQGYFEVELKAFSRDYFLTLDEYCRTYVGAKLGTDIISNHPLVKGNNPIVKFQSQPEKLQLTSFVMNNNTLEMKIPFSVQYNESFYKYASRMAHRVGEFMYYEGEELHLGIDPESKAHPLDAKEFKSIGGQALSAGYGSSPTNSFVVNSTHYNYLKPENVTPPDYPYDMDYSVDSFIDGIDTDVDKNPFISRWYNWCMFAKNMISIVTGMGGINDGFQYKTGFPALIVKLGLEIESLLVNAESDYKKKQKILKKGLENSRTSNNPYYIETEQLQNNILRAFSSFVENEQTMESNCQTKQNAYANAVKHLEDCKKAFANEQTMPLAQVQIENAFDMIDMILDQAKTLLIDPTDTTALPYTAVYSVVAQWANQMKNEYLYHVQLQNLTNPDKQTTEEDTTEVCVLRFADAVKKASDDLDELLKTVMEVKELKNEHAAQTRSVYRKLRAASYVLGQTKESEDHNTTKEKLKTNTSLTENQKKELKEAYFNHLSAEYQKEHTAEEAKKKAEEDANKLVDDFTKFASRFETWVGQMKQSITNCCSTLDNLASKYGTAFKEKESFAALIDANYQLDQARKNKEKTYQEWVDIVISLTSHNLYSQFLYNVQRNEDMMQQMVMDVELNENTLTFFPELGGKVTYGSTEYLIVKVTGQYGFRPAASGNSQLDWDSRLRIEMIPKLSYKVGEDEQTYWLPVKNACREVQKVGPMLATVIDSSDPWVMGRLRVRFNWQSEDDKSASPWIRLSVPMASKDGAGVHFIPAKGNEVLVDFYNGNIERPFVIGSLNNYNNPLAGLLGFDSYRRIANENGQSLTLLSGTQTVLGSFASVLPSLKPILTACENENSKWIKPLDLYYEEKEGEDAIKASQWRGAVSMGDCWSTWTIQGSTSDRKITIDSALGKVSISALTGIEIDAPLGDVSINAKNISLKASNNISIISGAEVARQRKMHEDYKKNPVKANFMQMASAAKPFCQVATIDFAFLRTCMEAIVPPIEGAMIIKSSRYMKLEAGKGKVNEPTSSYMANAKVRGTRLPKISSTRKKATWENSAIKAVEVLNNVKSVFKNINDDCRNFNDQKTNLYNAYKALIPTFGLENNETYLKSEADLFNVIIDLNNGEAGFGDAKTSLCQGNFVANGNQQFQAEHNAEIGGTAEAYVAAQWKKFDHLLYLWYLSWNKVIKLKNAMSDTSGNKATFCDYFKEKYKDKLNGLIIPYYKKDSQLDSSKGNFEAAFATALKGFCEKCISIQENVMTYHEPTEAFMESVRKYTVLKIISATGIYTISNDDVEDAKKDFLDNPLETSLLPAIGGGINFENWIGNLQVDSFSAHDGLEQADLTKNLNNWKIFVKACKFYTAQYTSDKYGKGDLFLDTLDVLGEATGINAILDGIQDTFAGPIAEHAQWHNDEYGGMMLFSDGKDTYGLGNKKYSSPTGKSWGD